MEAQNLYVKLDSGEFKSSHVWFCGKCRIVSTSQELAEQCCDKKCYTCLAPIEFYSVKCRDCSAKEYRAKEIEKIEKAELVEMGEYIYYHDEYYSQDDLYCYLEDNLGIEDLENCEEFGFDCDKYSYKPVDIVKYVRESCEEDHYEDSSEQLVGLDELAKHLDDFNAKQTIVSYMVNEGRKVSIKSMIDEVKNKLIGESR